jgi:putative endonuclease
VAFYVYILASQRNGTLYIGHTASLGRRTLEHQAGDTPSFVQKYGVTQLVYYESYQSRSAAFRRERAMKKWRRAWKIELIERFNPGWQDLSADLPSED